MASRWLCLGLAAAGLCASAPAFAASRPVIAPPASWVDVAPLPAAPPAEDSAALQTLLDDNQSRLGPQGDVFYTRRVVKVLRPEGLADLTTESLTWDPDTEVLTIHTIAIRRGGKVIDLLGDGQKLLVLRRETGLEAGMLDGRLTATLQVDGLQVGDVFDVAWSLAKRDPVTKGRSEDPEGLSSSGVTGRYRVRASWPSTDPVRWRLTDDLPKAEITTHGGRTELLLDVSDIKATIPPAGAPSRYAWVGRLYGSSYASWNEVSDQISPLFQQAAVLGPSSDLRAQAAAIAAKSTDPKVRAFEALKLVEDKIRYFYIGANEGGYIPASADQTWARRFGDCKGKTVVLLSLLHELGIKAEPALVSTGSGDGLDEDLPGLWRFDHVLVRAQIDGKVYWLDGTRQGDVGGVDEQKPPAWRWALPRRAGAAPLEPIVQPPLDEPMMDVLVHLDASKGLDAPAPGEFRMTVRGDAAVSMRLAVGRASKDDLIRLEKQAVANAVGWFEPKDVSWRDQPQDNAFEIDIKGIADLNWRENADLHMREYRFPTSAAGAKLFPERDPSSNQDAPFAVAYPLYVSGRTEVVLPDNGRSFQIKGVNVAETVGEYHVERTSQIVGGVASFQTSLRALAPEAPAAGADAANRELRRISDQETVIRVPDAAVKAGA
jgi:transglutaminase-like putative cysteine protease